MRPGADDSADAWAQLIGHEATVPRPRSGQVGPVTSKFSGKVHFDEDRNQHRAVFDAKGRRRAVPATRPPRSL